MSKTKIELIGCFNDILALIHREIDPYATDEEVLLQIRSIALDAIGREDVRLR